MRGNDKTHTHKKKLIIILLSVLALGAILFNLNMTSAKYVFNEYNSVAFSSSVTFNLASISNISGTLRVTQVLTAGTITPTAAAATASYQWLSCATPNGTYSPISGATSSAYTLTPSNLNCYIEVTATGTGSYTGSVTSAYVGPILAPPVTPLTTIGTITGTAQVSNTLTAGAVTPSGATYAYQWQRSSDNISFSDISGATSSTYTLVSADYTRYIRVAAIGNGSYSGTVVSAGVGPVTSVAVTAVAAPSTTSGTYFAGNILTCGVTTPANASVTYVWQRSNTSATTGFAAISGATSSTYTIATTDYGYYIRVVVTGISANGFTGTATSTSVGKVPTPLVSIGAFTGTMKVGNVVTASTTTSPTGATYTYQWQSSTTQTSTYTGISGATSNTYTLTGTEYQDYVRVAITGSGDYYGTVYSAAQQCNTALALTSVTLSSTTGIQVGQTLTTTVAPVPNPSTAVTYQWYRGTSTTTINTVISGATSSSYTVTSADKGNYLKVTVTAVSNGGYTGTVSANTTATVTSTLISVTITGTALTGQTLTAVLDPSDATSTTTFTWYRAYYTDTDGNYSKSLGTGTTYTVASGDFDYYIRVEAVANGVSYSGTVDSAGVRIAAPVTSVGPIGGTMKTGSTLTCGAILPSTATVSYQWQRSSDNVTYTDITGAVSGTYTVTSTDITGYVRIAVTGTGYYLGKVYSASIKAQSLTSVTISGTAKTGQTLTATISPSGASATYQWMKCSTSGGTYTTITGATTGAFRITANENGYFIKVQATGYDNGVVTSTATAKVTAGAITTVTLTGSAAVGSTLTATLDVPDPNITYTYTWQYSMNGSTYSTISGQTASTLYVTQQIWQSCYYIKCIVSTSSSAYTGTSTSNIIYVPA